MCYKIVITQQQVDELLAGITMGEGKDAILLGDFNARTASSQGLNGKPRISPDLVSNSMGNRLLQTCDDYGMYILNGTDAHDERSTDHFTSYQPGGSSVIDHAVATRGIYARRVVTQLRVEPHMEQWSDRARLILSVTLESIGSVSTRQAHRYASVAEAVPEGPPTLLDTVLEDVLAMQQPYHGAIEALYGVVGIESQERNPLNVYTDGSCLNPESKTARAGAGIFWGFGAAANRSLRVPGIQTNNRAELYAILHTIHQAAPHRSLRLFTDSTFAIQSICYYALQHAEVGWKCAHGDILSDIAKHIKRRCAPIQFCWVKGHVGNEFNEGADQRADEGARMPPVGNYTSLEVPEAWPLAYEAREGGSTLKACREPQRTAQERTSVPLTALPASYNVDHDDVELDLSNELQQEALRNMCTEGQFWQDFRSLTGGAQAREPQVTAPIGLTRKLFLSTTLAFFANLNV